MLDTFFGGWLENNTTQDSVGARNFLSQTQSKEYTARRGLLAAARSLYVGPPKRHASMTSARTLNAALFLAAAAAYRRLW